MPPVDLEGKRIVVLGGSGELGSRIAADLAERGARLVLAARHGAKLAEVAGRLGPTVGHLPFDLVGDDARSFVSACVEHLGGLDGVVNAAGVVAFGPLESLTDDALDILVATDFTGPVRVMRAALPHLEGGFLVNVTGVIAEQPVAGMAAYSAAKAGLSAATRALQRELRRRGIHVLDARPPHTETGLAGRPIEGSAPPLPSGLDPDQVAGRIVEGLAAGERELAATDFTS